MTKSKSLINAKPFKEAKVQKKQVNRKMNSVNATYQSQLKADPMMEMRRAIMMGGMNRRVEEARKELGR